MSNIDHDQAASVAAGYGSTFTHPSDASVKLVFAAYLELAERAKVLEQENKGLQHRERETGKRADLHERGAGTLAQKNIDLRAEAEAADAMWRERLRVAEEQVAAAVTAEAEAVKRADELEARVAELMDVLRRETVEVSAERSYCRECRSETYGEQRGREGHVHRPTCSLASPVEPPKPYAALPLHGLKFEETP